jgi:ABC-2 type transport system ATP-binding protein
MVEVRSVSKSFGPVHAVADVSLTLRPGEVTGLLGPNGAGKTTLIRMITGLMTPDRGAVSLFGHDSLINSGPARRILGFLPESAPSYPEMTVTEYLVYRSRLFPAPAGGRAAAVEHAIEACWLTEMRRRAIGKLSKGYRQRVGLAAALVHDPRVLVLDEPTTGLDPSQIRAMRDLIRSLAKGATADRVVLLSSHILPEVEQTCDRVVIMAGGRIRADGTPAGLVAAHAAGSPYVVSVREAAGVGPFARDLAAIPGVLRVQPAAHDEHQATFEVIAAGAAHDLREPIFAMAVRHGVTLRELSRRSATLEQVFVSVVESAGARTEREAA